MSNPTADPLTLEQVLALLDGVEESDSALSLAVPWLRENLPKCRVAKKLQWRTSARIAEAMVFEGHWYGVAMIDGFYWRNIFGESAPCDSLDHGKQLAQQHYDNLFMSMSKEVGE